MNTIPTTITPPTFNNKQSITPQHCIFFYLRLFLFTQKMSTIASLSHIPSEVGMNLWHCRALSKLIQTHKLNDDHTGDVGGASSKRSSLRWRHNGRDSVSNHQPHHCLLNRLFRRISKKTSKLRVTGLCMGNSPGTGEFPAQVASNAENVSIWWRYHEASGVHENSVQWVPLCTLCNTLSTIYGSFGNVLLMTFNCINSKCFGKRTRRWYIVAQRRL